MVTLGATREEAAMPLLGDDLIPEPRRCDRAVQLHGGGSEENELLAFRATIHPITGRPVDLAEIDHDNTAYPGAYLDFSGCSCWFPRARRPVVDSFALPPLPAWWVYAMVEGYELVDAIFTSRSLRAIERRAEGRVRTPVVPPQPGHDRGLPGA